MKPFLLLRADDLEAQRPPGQVDDIHFTEDLARAVVEEATRPGDLVLDPFAGYGTTLAVAGALGRRAVGVELLPEHAQVARDRSGAEVIGGDARRLAPLLAEAGIGPVDLVLTSPPYLSDVDHRENPLTGYRTDDGDYRIYLQEIGEVFAQVASVLGSGGRAVVNVANVLTGGHVTPLAWDVGREVARSLDFQGETFLCWDRHPPGLAGDYLLWFRKT